MIDDCIGHPSKTVRLDKSKWSGRLPDPCIEAEVWQCWQCWSVYVNLWLEEIALPSMKLSVFVILLSAFNESRININQIIVVVQTYGNYCTIFVGKMRY